MRALIIHHQHAALLRYGLQILQNARLLIIGLSTCCEATRLPVSTTTVRTVSVHFISHHYSIKNRFLQLHITSSAAYFQCLLRFPIDWASRQWLTLSKFLIRPLHVFIMWSFGNTSLHISATTSTQRWRKMISYLSVDDIMYKTSSPISLISILTDYSLLSVILLDKHTFHQSDSE